VNPEVVKCPVCLKIGYTDERHEVDGSWPCAKHYLELMSAKNKQWPWNVKKQE